MNMAKIQIKSERLTPFGGLFSIMEQFDSTCRVNQQVQNYNKWIFGLKLDRKNRCMLYLSKKGDLKPNCGL